MKYGMLIEDARKAARRPLHQVAEAMRVSRHVLRCVERGTNPPFTASYNEVLLTTLGVSDEVRAKVMRAWKSEQVANMSPRATGHGLGGTSSAPIGKMMDQLDEIVEQVERAAKPDPVRELGKRALAEALTPGSEWTFAGTVAEVRESAAQTLRRFAKASKRRARVTITLY